MAASKKRKDAALADLQRYEGAPCVKCGNPIRYVSNGACVLCVGSRSKKGERRAQYLRQRIAMQIILGESW